MILPQSSSILDRLDERDRLLYQQAPTPILDRLDERDRLLYQQAQEAANPIAAPHTVSQNIPQYGTENSKKSQPKNS